MRRPHSFVHLPAEQARWARSSRRVDGVVLAGPSAGGPAHLSGRLLTVLLEVERRGLHLVLVAHRIEDLDTDVAAVCRHVIAADEQILHRARERWGVSQVLPVQALDDGSLDRALRRLPTPASRTLLRAVHTQAMRLRRRLHSLSKAARA